MSIMNNALQDQSRSKKLSILWLVIALNIILADVLSVYVELVNHNTLNIPGDVTVFMVIGALFVNIPILMIYLTRYAGYRIARPLNIVAASITALFVIGGGSSTPHYLLIACIELIVLGKIVFEAWKWKLSA